MAQSPQVLIVGGGLVGLSAAMFLAHRGVPVVLAEKHPGSSPHPRAIGYTTRTLELFRAVGLDLPRSSHESGPPRRARVESLAGTWFEEYPWSPAGAAKPEIEYSPVAPTAIAQDTLEPILRAKAIELGADVRMNTEMTRFTTDDDGVTASLRQRDGREYDLRAGYLIAADGVHSQVRDALGIGRTGRGLLAQQRSILFRAPLDTYLERGVVQFEIEQPGLSAFLTTYSDGRWVLMLSDDIERTEAGQLDLVHRAIGRSDLDVELLTTGRWELAALIADQFSAGRVFLAGDAAHQLPPNRGGYGANTGIDDADNLAAKLADVLSGSSAPALLATYDAERRPIAWLRHEQIFARADYKARLDAAAEDVPIIDDIAMELGQLYRSAAILDTGASTGPELPRAQRPDQWAGQPGTRAPHLRLPDGRSTLDLFHHGWVLLSADELWSDPAARTAAALAADLTFAPITVPGFGAAYGLGPAGATLVRPDGYIAWRAVTAPADPALTLAAALAEVSFATASGCS